MDSKNTLTWYSDSQMVENIMTKTLHSPNDIHTQPQVLPEDVIKKSHKQKIRQRSITIAACVLVGVTILIVGLIIHFQRPGTPQQARQNTPTTISWSLQTDQTSLRSNQNIFDIKYVVIHAHEILFVYASTHPIHNILSAQVTTSPGNKILQELPLHSSIQKLGQLGAYDTGIIHVQNLNKVGQIIQLKITFSGSPATIAILQPVKQDGNGSTSDNGYVALTVQTPILAEVQWNAPLYASLAYFKGPNKSYVFLKTALDGGLQVINKEEFLKASKRSSLP